MIIAALVGLAASLVQGAMPMPCAFGSIIAAERADRLLVSCRDRPEFFVLSSSDGRTLRHLILAGPGQAPINNLAFSTDGQQIATSARDGTIFLFPAKSDTPRRWTAGFYANSLVFSPDGRRLYVDGRELDTGTALPTGRSLRGAFDAPNAIAFDEPGREAVVAEADTTVRLFDLASGKQLASADFALEPLNVDIDRQSSNIAVGLADGTIILFDRRLRPLQRFSGLPGMMPVLMLASGTHLVAALAPQSGGARPAPFVLDFRSGKWAPLASATGAVAAQRRGKTILVYKLEGSVLRPQKIDLPAS